MLIAGAIVTGLGLILGFTGFLMMRTSLSIGGRRVLSTKLEGGSAKAGPATVDPTRPCRIVVEMNVESRAVIEEKHFEDVRHKLRFRFPFRYQVTDASGAVIHSDNKPLDWQTPLRSWGGKEDAGGGKIRNCAGLDPFTVPHPGTVHVEATLSDDTEFQATADDVRLYVHDRTDTGTGCSAMFNGVVLMAIAPLLLLAGIILLLVGWLA